MSQPTQIQHCRGCSCQAAINLAQDTQQLVDLVKTANHATSAIAEALRVQSHALLAVVERDNLKPQPATLAPAPPNTNPYGGILMVISERVGSISVEQWNGMSDGDLEDLDRVLKKTVNRSHLGTWMESGVRIQAELAAVGLVFKTVDECLPLNTSRDWKILMVNI